MNFISEIQDSWRMSAMLIALLPGLTIIICSHGINSRVTSMNILDKMPSSDHLPLQAEIDVDFNGAFNLIDVNTCPRYIVSYKWSQCTPDDLHQYCCSTYALFSDIYVTPGV